MLMCIQVHCFGSLIRNVNFTVYLLLVNSLTHVTTMQSYDSVYTTHTVAITTK